MAPHQGDDGSLRPPRVALEGQLERALQQLEPDRLLPLEKTGSRARRGASPAPFKMAPPVSFARCGGNHRGSGRAGSLCGGRVGGPIHEIAAETLRQLATQYRLDAVSPRPRPRPIKRGGGSSRGDRASNCGEANAEKTRAAPLTHVRPALVGSCRERRAGRPNPAVRRMPRGLASRPTRAASA